VTKTTIYLDSDTALFRKMSETQGAVRLNSSTKLSRAYTGKAKRPRIPGICEFDSGRTDIWAADERGLELQQPLGFRRQILHLRENLVLQLRIVAHPGI